MINVLNEDQTLIQTRKYFERNNNILLKPGIQERGTECGECGEWAFRGMLKKIPGNVQKDSGECSTGFRGMFNKTPGNAQEDSGECSKRFRGMFQKIPGNVQKDSGECSKRFRGMLKKIPGNVRKDSGECSKRFRGMLEKIPGNVWKDSGESKFRFILRNLANSAIKWRQNKGIFSMLLLTTYNWSPTLKYCFSSTFFLSLFFLLSRKGCNYYAQVQGYQKTLNNPQLRGLKNMQSWNHQLLKIGFKNLTFKNLTWRSPRSLF